MTQVKDSDYGELIGYIEELKQRHPHHTMHDILKSIVEERLMVPREKR